MSFSDISLRLISSFIVLLLLTRIMGRKEIGQLTFFNFVSAIAIGSIASSLAVIENLSIANGIYALTGWALLTIIVGFIDIKSKKTRLIVEGQPVIVIKEGKVMENELRKLRLDMNALNALLRKKNVFSIEEVDYAILETDGKLSVMKIDDKQPLTKKDMNVRKVKTNLYPIPTEIISDGKFNEKNLSKLKIDESWVLKQLHEANIQSVSEVFYAEIQKDGTLYIDKRNDDVH
jgi:uncharacterized membrane protein YcaP (DUF421 family)